MFLSFLFPENSRDHLTNRTLIITMDLLKGVMGLFLPKATFARKPLEHGTSKRCFAGRIGQGKTKQAKVNRSQNTIFFA